MIKSDKWIRRMAEQYGMIEPFEPQQVRERNPDLIVNDQPLVVDKHLVSPGRIISYGTSSYGYDARCAGEFKVFTNINSTVVDPKAFDPRNFVDVEAGHCVIPPNSFALARTVEYFRIPRNVLVICLGKSTYARCFTGDTKVALVDGRSLSLKQMTNRAKKGERFFGYTIDKKGGIAVAELIAPRKTDTNRKLVEVRLDNGRAIRCTPDHEFMLRDGAYRQARHLRPNDSLMPLYRYDARGYEMVYDPAATMLVGTHRLSDKWNLKHGVYEKSDEPEHRHHVDENKRNNDPRNIVRMSARDHILHHNAEKYSDPKYMAFHTKRIKEGMRKYLEENWDEFVVKNRQKFVDFHTLPKYARKRRERIKKIRKFWSTQENRDAQAERLRRAWERSPESFPRKHGKDHHRYKKLRKSEIERLIIETGKISSTAQALGVSKQVLYRRYPNLLRRLKPYLDQSGDKSYRFRRDLSDKMVRKSLRHTRCIAETCRELGVSKHTIRRRFQHVVTTLQQDGTLVVNHRVASVRELHTREDVYDVTVPGTHNFALESGVFVHNCGIVVNVTPLEPEWEGHVTLEFSNTTPLPAKIYANEGVAQFLFFESDEECQVSYADRNGKYQGQRGVTLPRT